jgi:cytochrome P450
MAGGLRVAPTESARTGALAWRLRPFPVTAFIRGLAPPPMGCPVTPVLTHDVGTDGQLADHWAYHRDGSCPAFRVPGSASGAQVILLRTWRSAMAALRSLELRDLAAVDQDHALAGITHEHPAGLLRREATELRSTLNPMFSIASVEAWRLRIGELADQRAGQLRNQDGRSDLATSYCELLAGDVTCLVTGLEPDQWRQLVSLSGRANALILTPADHARASAARDELYQFCAPVVDRARRGELGPTLLEHAVRMMDYRGLSAGETLQACSTILGGFPSLVPVLSVMGYESLRRPGMLAECAGRPDLVRAAVWEHLRHSAHFTFALPGVVRTATDFGFGTVPAGATVRPVIHAAQHDPAHTPGPDPARFDIRRPRAALLAFGAGVHACLGRALTLAVLEEALRALADLTPQPQLAVAPSTIAWRSGLMPVPSEIPVVAGI